ncbi:MAG: universal stress protein [Niastella sp.]|nr:universal stress protein [Niastella sp.]
MKRILVPTDFSANAETAFKFALYIAKLSKGTIILYHTYIPLENPFIGDKTERAAHNFKTETMILKKLHRFKNKIVKKDDVVSISTIIGRSPLINNILGFAEHNHIDLIVMGTKGASGIKKVLLGSVAARVAQRSDLPVLLIPEKCKVKSFSQIVFATDFTPWDEPAIKRVLSFAKLENGAVTVIHVMDNDMNEKKKNKSINDFESYAFYMQRKINRRNLKFQLIETKAKDEKIITLMNHTPYDMLAIVRKNKSFFHKLRTVSYTKNLAFMMEKPLLMNPPE